MVKQKKVIQYLSRSLKISRLAKNRCYGHYCNLTRKYNYPRLNYYSFTPSEIMIVEYRYLNENRKKQNELIS